MSRDNGRFPVLHTYREQPIFQELGCPLTVPWEMVEPHERQALQNHGQQSLARLSNRGGLAACELVAVLEDRRWHAMPIRDAVARLLVLLETHRTEVQHAR